MPPSGRHPSARRHAASAISGAIDHERIERLLAPWLPEARDRAFVARCILDEGPIHHRGANYALLALIGRALALAPEAGPPPTPYDAVPVHMRVPPHLRGGGADQDYPLGVPRAALSAAADGDAADSAALADALTDGPPHHALANAAMVTLLGELVRRLERR